MQHWWNNTVRGIPKFSEKSLSQCHLVTKNLTWTCSGSNPSLRGENLSGTPRKPLRNNHGSLRGNLRTS